MDPYFFPIEQFVRLKEPQKWAFRGFPSLKYSLLMHLNTIYYHRKNEHDEINAFKYSLLPPHTIGVIVTPQV